MAFSALCTSTVLVVGTIQSLIIDLVARVSILMLVCLREIMVVPGIWYRMLLIFSMVADWCLYDGKR